jgi:phosphoribosylamine--glycine ligase
MLEKVYGESGARVILEECVSGPEMTVLAFTDGESIKPMICSQDHKRAFDGDMGPNTGGMGAFAPSPVYTGEVERECVEKVFMPTLGMLKSESIKYRGVLYFGLMLTAGGVKVIEYNSRFGDPETQVVLPLLKNDLLDVANAVIDGRLGDIELEWENGYAACVVAASDGYPGNYKTGCEIKIADGAEIRGDTALFFHSGTRVENGGLVTSGGRVLGAAAFGATLGEAVGGAYAGISRVSFEGMRYRKDIGTDGR